MKTAPPVSLLFFSGLFFVLISSSYIKSIKLNHLSFYLLFCFVFLLLLYFGYTKVYTKVTHTVIETGEPIVCYFLYFCTIDYFWVGSLFFKCLLLLCLLLYVSSTMKHCAEMNDLCVVVDVTHTAISAFLLFFYCFSPCVVLFFLVCEH